MGFLFLHYVRGTPIFSIFFFSFAFDFFGYIIDIALLSTYFMDCQGSSEAEQIFMTLSLEIEKLVTKYIWSVLHIDLI